MELTVPRLSGRGNVALRSRLCGGPVGLGGGGGRWSADAEDSGDGIDETPHGGDGQWPGGAAGEC